MKLHFFKTVLATAAIGAFLALAGAPAAKADDRDDYRRRPAYSDWRYQERREAFERREHLRHERLEHRYDYRRDWDRR